jgi:hypothetical protein
VRESQEKKESGKNGSFRQESCAEGMEKESGKNGGKIIDLWL